MSYIRGVVLACICGGLIVGGAGCGCGKKPPAKPDDPVIATVDGREILASDLLDEYLKVPAEHRAQYEADRQALLGFIINRYVIAAEARAAKVDTEPSVLQQINDTRRFALRMELDRELLRMCEPTTDRAHANEQLAKVRAATLESARSEAVIETHPERLTDEPADTDVVATVNDTTFTVADARHALDSMSPPEQAACRADAARLIDTLVDNELLVQEALRRGLDKKPEFKLRMARATDAVLVREMRRRALEQIKAEISDAELRTLAAKEAGGELPNELIVLYAIVNPDKAQLERASTELDAGKPFTEVHAAYSTEKNPDFGTYSDKTISTAPEPVRAAVRQLKDGEHSGVIELDGRFVLLQVTRRAAVVDLEPFREQLLARRQDELFLGWVLKKREKHSIEYTDRLDKVKLPRSTTAPPASTPAGP
jgi:hypothetical protein